MSEVHLHWQSQQQPVPSARDCPLSNIRQTCHGLYFSVSVLFSTCYFHLGLHFFLFSSSYEMIPLGERSLCAGSTGRQTNGQDNLQAWLKSFLSVWKICPHAAVRLQASGTEHLSSTVSLSESVREPLAANTAGN